MSDELFRKKSMDSISSPEQLTDYIRVANPGVWLLLAAIIALLAGVCVWGLVGRLDTKLPVAVVSEGGVAECYVSEDDVDSIAEGMRVDCWGGEYEIENISRDPVEVDEDFNEYARHVGDLKIGEWVFTASFRWQEPDGVYEANIITDSVSPLSFVFN